MAAETSPVGVPLVVTQLPAGTDAERQGPRAQGMRPADYGDGARLVLVRPDGSVKPLAEGFQSACDPEVSFDGKRVLCAGKHAAADPWNIFEIDLTSGQVRQITRDLGDCRRPIYLSSFYTITENEPWDQIGFVSTGAGQRDEFGGAPATSLYTCKLDGSFAHRITYNLSSDDSAAIMPDGQLLYASWHRATFEDGLAGRIGLESMNTDGSDRAPFVPRGRRIQHMPCLTMDGRAVFVEADALPWDGAGRLASVGLRRPLHSYEPIAVPDELLFHSPAALPGGRILVSARPADGSGTHGVFCLDLTSKTLAPVFDDPKFHDIQAKPVCVRRRPDGRSSVVSERDETATLYGLNLYTTDFPRRDWLPTGSVKTLRVIEGIPAKTSADGAPKVPQLSSRRILAEVPVPADGSFHLVVPANTPLQLQILDERGLALRSCGWIWRAATRRKGASAATRTPSGRPTIFFRKQSRIRVSRY